LPRIETRPKPVYAQNFQDFAGVGQRADLRGELDDIIERIERGDGVPERYYRAGIDRNADDLLATKGIMHLHLGGKNSDVVVFLIQYASRVVLLETNSHVHFRTQPPGKNILALTQSWLGNLEASMAEAEAATDQACEGTARDLAEARRAKIAAAIAAFKARTGLR